MIAQNLTNIRNRIAEICKETNRNPQEVKLIAVSKNFPFEKVEEALSAGQTDFGENRVQELVSKYEKIGQKVNWHLIGTLQRNKAKNAVKTASVIHSVDSLPLLLDINKYAEQIGKVQKILLQFKTSDEFSKAGIETKDELKDIVIKCNELKNIELIGLMTIGPLTDNKEKVRGSFKELSELRRELSSIAPGLKELSMGMSDDFDIAIQEGATMIRIGSAIFGERDYSISWKEL